MSSAPSFASTPKAWGVTTAATLDTSKTAPTNTATLVTGGANGSKVEQVRCMQLATTNAVVLVNLFLYDGTTYHFFDFFEMWAGLIDTTHEVKPQDLFYDDLEIPNGWSLRATVTTAEGQSNFKLTAWGGDY